MATVKKIKKAENGLRAKADNTSVKKPEISKVPGTKYKYLDDWTASGKTPSSQDSAQYKRGYNIGVRGRKPGLFEPLRTHIGAEEGLESNKKYEKKKAGGKVAKDKNWIQKAVNPAHKGYCTPMTKATCTPKRKALAKTFKKMAKARKGK